MAMTDFPTEEQHRLRKNPAQIGHIVTVCPKCHVNNFWTKSQEIGGEMYYWQRCGSCGYEES
jgi:predicted nucleic-acid-binding Zn-ribbon protein